MSAYVIKISPDSICATCLSHGRKMYQAKSYPPSNFMLVKDFILTGHGRLCWECHSFVLKMEAFRQRALTAQACFAALLKREQTILQSLSNLRTTSTSHLDIENHPQASTNTENLIEMVTIKSENDFINVTNEDEVANDVKDEIEDNVARDDNDEMKYNIDNEASAKEYATSRDEITNSKLFRRLTQVRTVTHNFWQQSSLYGNSIDNSEDIANATLAWLLNKKRSDPPLKIPKVPSIEIDGTSSFKILSHKSLRDVRQKSKENSKLENENSGSYPPLETPKVPSIERDGTSSFKILSHKPLQDDKQKSKENSEPENENCTNVSVTSPFTEERISEDDLAKWWERKRQEEFYANSISVFRCDKCLEPFNFRPSFKAHQKMHTELYGDLSCDVCLIRCTDEDILKSHKEKHYRLLKCAYCPFQWDNPNSMRQHCRDCHKVPVKVYTCEFCSQEAPTRHKTLLHRKSHTAWKCPECGVKLRNYTRIAHILLHERGAEKPYSCNECGRKFHTKPLLKSHMKIHNKEVNGETFCFECNLQFKDKHSYHRHMTVTAKHAPKDCKESLKRYKCNECGHAYTGKSQLREHIESRHNELRSYSCDSCSKTFKTRKQLRRHKRAEALPPGALNVKNKICDYCGKAFSSKTTLVDHINSHTGARPYKCHLCGDTFGHQSARYLHLRFKHKIPKKTPKEG